MFTRLSLPNASHRFLSAALKSFAAAMIVMSGWNAVTAQPEKKNSPAPTETAAQTPQEQIEQLQKRLAALTSEVARLRAEVAKLEKYRQIDYTRAQIKSEEDRIRSLQLELNDIAAKETTLHKRLDEIEKEQPPDRIERSMAGVGSTRPDAEREAISRQLANEKRQIQNQLETLRSNRLRIDSQMANADASIARLKRRLSELSR